MIRAIQGNSCILLSKFLNRMNGLNRPDAIIYLLIAITLLCPNELNMQCFPYFTPLSSDDEFYQSSGTIFQKLKLFTCTENFLKGSIFPCSNRSTATTIDCSASFAQIPRR